MQSYWIPSGIIPAPEDCTVGHESGAKFKPMGYIPVFATKEEAEDWAIVDGGGCEVHELGTKERPDGGD